jgi:hypothetical protein
VGPGQERPTNLDLTLPFVIAVEPRGSDGAAVFAVEGQQRATGLPGFAEEGLENLLLVPILAWVLFPNERVSGHGEKVLVILRTEWPEFQEVPRQTRLGVEWHP